jgi:hypothetical protein
MDSPRRSAPANPPTPHAKPAPDHTGETASGSHTAAGAGTSSVFPIVPREPKADYRVGEAGGASYIAVPVLNQVCPELTDASLQELSERETDVRLLSFRSIDFTDKGLKYLAAVKSLKALQLRQTKVTEAG